MKKTCVNLGSECVLLGLGLLLLMAQPVHAVVGNVTIMSGSEPVAGVTIVFQTPDGQVVTEEEESDDDGKAVIFIPDSHKGSRLVVVTTRDGTTRRQDVNVGQDDTLTIVVRLPGPGPMTQTAGDGVDLALTITGLYKWADFDGSFNYVTGGETGRGDLDDSGGGFGADLEIRPARAAFRGRPLFVVVGFGLPLDVDQVDVYADVHPTPGNDLWQEVVEKWILRSLLGCEVFSGPRGRVAVLGGVQLTGVEARLITDETGGGGVLNRFVSSEALVSPVLGVGFTRPLGHRRAELVANVYVTWLGDVDGSGQSTLGLNYNYRAEGGVQTEFQIGVRIPLR